MPNFIALHLEEKPMRYDFFSKCMHWNLKKTPENIPADNCDRQMREHEGNKNMGHYYSYIFIFLFTFHRS